MSRFSGGFSSRKQPSGVPSVSWLGITLLTAVLLHSAAALKAKPGVFPKFGRSLIGPDPSASAAHLAASTAAIAMQGSVSLPLGTVTGMACAAEGVTQYLGIPYAESVTGAARFTPPRARSTAYPNSALNASTIPPPCGCVCAPYGQSDDTSAEECLFLNIWVPPGVSASSETKRPVRVYMHGGNIMSCSASDEEWNGCNAAAKTGMIHVNMQYRMGPFGLLAHPLLMEEFNTTGNWALLDQQLALKWVQEHIGYFGGDPTRVLLNGHSKGGQLVDYHMLAPGSAGLFSAAISMSPSCEVLRTLEQSYDDTQRLMKYAGCAPRESPAAELECMRTMPYKALRELAEGIENSHLPSILWCDRESWKPVVVHTVDGTTIPQPLRQALEEGNFHKVPYMTGLTTAESGAFADLAYPDGVTYTDFIEFIDDMFPGADPEPILAQYPYEHFAGAPEPTTARFTQLWSDANWSCPIHMRINARLTGLKGTSVPTYMYYWGTNPSCPPNMMSLGPYHGSELWFAFGNTDDLWCSESVCPSGKCSLNEPEKDLSEKLLAAITAMAETGAPRWQNGTAWPTWDPVHEMGTYLNAGLEMSLPIGFKNRCTVLEEAKQLSRR